MHNIKKTEDRILKLLIVINNFNFKIIQVTFNKADSGLPSKFWTIFLSARSNTIVR